MGYSSHLHLIDKKTAEIIHSLNREDFRDLYRELDYDGYIALYDIFQSEIYDLGKYIDQDLEDCIINTGQPLFSDKDLILEYEDYNAHIVGKEALENIIDWYTKRTLKFLASLISDTPDKEYRHSAINSKEERVVEHIRNRVQEIIGRVSINLNERYKYHICNSWSYEDAVFNLAHAYKIIDWDKDCLVYIGW